MIKKALHSLPTNTLQTSSYLIMLEQEKKDGQDLRKRVSILILVNKESTHFFIFFFFASSLFFQTNLIGGNNFKIIPNATVMSRVKTSISNESYFLGCLHCNDDSISFYNVFLARFTKQCTPFTGTSHKERSQNVFGHIHSERVPIVRCYFTL